MSKIQIKKTDCPFCGERKTQAWEYQEHVTECANKSMEVEVTVSIACGDRVQTHTVSAADMNSARGKALNFMTFIERDWEI